VCLYGNHLVHLCSTALPEIALFRSLEELISSYPIRQTLRESVLDQLYDLLQEHLGDDVQATRMLCGRFTGAGTDVVEGIKKANEEFMKAVRRSKGRKDMCCGYREFVDEWCEKDIDGNLVGDDMVDILNQLRGFVLETLS
jgi:U3 small nucleolar RNA-associated protein 6